MNIKTFFLSALLAFSSSFMFSDMTWNPVDNTLYSMPMTSDINQAEYFCLFLHCVNIGKNMILICGKFDSNQAIKQMIHFLKGIESPTSKRLIADLEKNIMFCPDGSLAGTIF